MNSNDQYRAALSQGMTPCEAEQEVAEAEEYERIERETEARNHPVTGWDNGLSQDYNKKLSRWFASKPGAKQEVRELIGEKP